MTSRRVPRVRMVGEIGSLSLRPATPVEEAAAAWRLVEPHLDRAVDEVARLLERMTITPDQRTRMRDRFLRGYVEHNGDLWQDGRPRSRATLTAEAIEELDDAVVYLAMRLLRQAGA